MVTKLEKNNLAILTMVIRLDPVCRQDISTGVNLIGTHSSQAIAVAKGLCAKTSNEGLTKQILSTQLFYAVNMFPQLTA